MFTGIVQKLVKINSIDKQANLIRLGLGLDDIAGGLELGASVAINGVCLTVSEIAEDLVYFDVIPETLETTNLNSLSVYCLKDPFLNLLQTKLIHLLLLKTNLIHHKHI